MVDGVNVELVIDQSWPLSSEPPPSFVRLPVTANVVLNPEYPVITLELSEPPA